MEDGYFRRLFSLGILVVLLIMCYFILKPILMAIVTGLIFAFIFTPLYNKILKKTKSQNFSSAIICIALLLLIVLPLWFLVPIGVDHAVKLYFASQDFDFVTPLKTIFPSIFETGTLATEAGNALQSLITTLTDKVVRGVSSLLLELPNFALQTIVMFFTLFFVLRDKDRLFDFISSFSPFARDIEKKLVESSSGITASILYGQVVIGGIQGIIAGIGFFLFGVPNALLFAIFAILAGIFPVIGTTIVWIPVLIYALFKMSLTSVLGILIFGLISTNIDNFLRPMIIGRRVKIPSPIIIIGMIGGVYYFGVLGFILGPLILSYLLIVLESYQLKKRKSKFFIEEERNNFSLMKLNR